MKCKNCGEELSQGKNFCTNCGTKIAIDSPMQDVGYQNVNNTQVINNQNQSVAVENNVNNSNVINNQNQNINQNNFVNNSNVVNNQNQNINQNNFVNNSGVTNNNVVDEERKKANNLCIISLICHYVVPVVSAFISGLMSGLFSETATASTADFVMLCLYGSGSISGVVSWILMIVARVKYPQSKFGKVVMWIYIIEFIVAIIGVILLVAAFVALFAACAGSCQGMG